MSCVGPRLAERPPDIAETQELAHKVYTQLDARNHEIKTLRAEASLRMSHGLFSRAMDQYVLIVRPDRLRIDSHDPSGTLIAQIVYADGEIFYSEPATGYFRSSDDTEKILQEEVGLSISVDDLLLLISGGIPLEPRDHYLAVSQGGNVLLRGEDSQVELKEETGLPFRYVRRMADGKIYEAKFGNYQVINGVWFPIQMGIKSDDPDVIAEVSYLGAELNDTIDPGLFAPPIIPVDAGWGE